MARQARLVIPSHVHHVLQRGHDGQRIFQDVEDYRSFLAWVGKAATLFGVAIHAYVLMPNHVHFMVTPMDEQGLGRMMQWVGRHYVPYFNHKYGRTGTLWQGRFKASVIDAERYFITCCRYIESNPKRCGLVEDLVEFPWSSYAHHRGLKSDLLIHDHPLYWELGNTPFEREAAYKELIEQELTEDELMQIDHAVLKGWPLASSDFQRQLEKQVNRRIGLAKRGRPQKIVASVEGVSEHAGLKQ